MIIFISFLILSDYFTDQSFDISVYYHGLRSQSTVKFYGLIMTLEVIDKMMYHFGEFLIQDLLWKSPQSVRTFFAALIYNVIHAWILFLLLIVYNVLLNSDIQLFFILIFANNSMKLKSTLFKKFNEQAYWNQTHSDLIARTQKMIFIILIYLISKKGFTEDILKKLFLLFIVEPVTEYIKHISIAKMNNLNVQLVKRMSYNLKNFTFLIINLDNGKHLEDENFKIIEFERERQIAKQKNVEHSFKLGFYINFIIFPYSVLILKIVIPMLA